MTERAPGGLGRRAVLAGVAALLAAPAVLRAAAEAEPVEAILARSELGDVTGFAVVDLGAGALLEQHRGDERRPPASVVKVLTALYALEALGPEYRFHTRLIATGPVEGGLVRGDLVLAGGGDPLLDTDALGDMVQALARAGVTGVSGRLLVADGALPTVLEIDPSQPVEAGYNPAVSGMNLNFNRVHLDWSQEDAGPLWRLTAPGLRHTAEVAGVRVELAEGAGPRHRSAEGGEVWLLPPGSLRGRGSLWLPVRAPARYAAEVFGRLTAVQGVALPAAEVVSAAPEGAVLVERPSAAVQDMVRGMLRHSTNLTAEVLGLRAGQARGAAPDTLRQSAGAMADWARARYDAGAVLVNHSGLSDASRLAPADMARVLAAEQGRLPELLRERTVLDPDRRPVPGARVLAKTGTLFFASALAGYIEGPQGRRLGFAIFAADMAARAKVPPRYPVAPPGARTWAARARAQEQALLRRWLTLHA